MANLNLAYNNHVRFVLKSDNSIVSYKMDNEPVGWKGDDIGLNRHTDYHGVFFNFTSDLEFYGEAKDYIETAYRVGGINTILRLRKDIKYDYDGDVKWKVRYIAIADFETMVVSGNKLKIKFNSLNIETIIKSHETDEFDIDRTDTIDGDELEPLVFNVTELTGRNLVQWGESIISEEMTKDISYFGATTPFRFLGSGIDNTAITKIIGEGPDRQASVDVFKVGDGDQKASNMFYVDRTGQYIVIDELNLDIEFDIEFFISYGNIWVQFEKFKWNDPLGEWELQETNVLGNYTAEVGSAGLEVSLKEKIEFLDVKHDEGILLAFKAEELTAIQFKKQTLKISEETLAEKTPAVNFLFNHDLIDRLIYIMTGRNDAFYSKYFGRTDLGYSENGEGGLVGVISGFLVRGFEKGSDLYKSIKISLKDVFSSSHSVFNVGVGIETINLKERVRVEDMRYFYQNSVAVKLPNPVSELSREVDKTLFFSGISFGYDKSGAYEGTTGLDEPNAKTDWTTPIRRSSGKYDKISKIRTDETAMEIARRKPQSEFPQEDTKYDDVNWFLDLKETEGLNYTQKIWSDRLSERPSGIFSSDTYHNFWFTPLQMLKRHAWIFKAGMELYSEKSIRFISSIANSTLQTLFIGDTKAIAENDDLVVGELDRPRFVAEKVKFRHPVSDDLMDLIVGTTRVFYKGSWEDIPNYYFQFEYTNDDNKTERGYLLNLEPGDNPEFTMQKVNDNVLLGGFKESYNTEIGGIGKVFTTKEAFAAEIHIDPNIIQNFEIIDYNIRCLITCEYSIGYEFAPNPPFQNEYFSDGSPTYYLDLDGMCYQFERGAFYNSLNTLDFYFPNVVKIEWANFYHSNYTANNGLKPIERIYLPKCVDIGDPTVIDYQMFGFTPRPQHLIINKYHLTSNNGGVDATIQQAIDNDGLTVEYVD